MSLRPESSPVHRASSWQEIFSDPAEADRHFELFLVATTESYAERIESLQRTILPNGEIKITVRGKPGYPRHNEFTRLTHGDVLLRTGIGTQQENERCITPDAGNIHHSYTFEDTVIPRSEALFRQWLARMKTFSRNDVPQQSIKGKPATQEWETIMKDVNGTVPLRIGYRLYPENTIAAAHQVRLLYPEWFDSNSVR